MPDIDTMTTHELICGLMRGNRLDFQAGYSAPNAALAASERKGLSSSQVPGCTWFAEGFYDGMTYAMHRDDAAVEVREPSPPEDPELRGHYTLGYSHGKLEDGASLYPTPSGCT